MPSRCRLLFSSFWESGGSAFVPCVVALKLSGGLQSLPLHLRPRLASIDAEKRYCICFIA